MKLAAVALALLLIACGNARGSIPATPHRWLTDTVGYLTPEVQKAIDERLEAYEQQSKHQVFIWIGAGTNGEPHGDYCFRAFNAWGIGRAGHDDGVVLFLFVRDDMRWITVGYGLEAALSDREAVRICREIIGPMIRSGDRGGAIHAGLSAILLDIEAWEHR